MKRTDKLLAALPENTAALLHNTSNIFYLSGYTGEGLLLVAPGISAVITDFRYVEAAQKQCPGFTVHAIRAGVSHAQVTFELLEAGGIKKLAIEDNVITVRGMRDIEKVMPGMEFIPLDFRPEKLREVKDDDELSRIERACDITCQAFEYICGFIAPNGRSVWRSITRCCSWALRVLPSIRSSPRAKTVRSRTRSPATGRSAKGI